jgi:integrase/recombinase XerD
MPKIKVVPRKVVVHGLNRWRVTIPKSIAGDRRATKFFASKADADVFAKDLEIKRLVGRRGLMRFTPDDQSRLSKCLLEARDDVGFVVQAVKKALELRPANGTTLEEASVECLQSKKEAGMRPRYISSLKSVLGQFCLSFPGSEVDSITGEDVSYWLNSNDWSAATRRSKLTDIRTLFSFSIKKGYRVDNPAKEIEKPRFDEKPPEILTPDQCRELLQTVVDQDLGLVPYVSVCLFAGLRPEQEASQLDWSDFKATTVEVRAATAKSRKRRLVDIQPNLKVWLKLKGDLPVVNLAKRMRKIKDALSFTWPHDCLRHSFASYHFAMFGSADQTATQMGHSSTQMLFEHYREVVTKEDAKAFWKIRP